MTTQPIGIAVHDFFVALVYDVSDVWSPPLARRIARRVVSDGFAGGPGRHRLVLKSRRRVSSALTVPVLAVRAAMEQGYLRQSRRFANSLQVKRA